MPPKTPNKTGEGVSLSQADIDFTVEVLKEVGAMEVDWRAVAATVGISRHDNATARFNGVLKKLGCKLIKGKVVSLDEAAAASSNGLATPSKPTKAPAKAKTPATGRKRKAKDTTTAAEADDGANAKKKAKLEEENEKGEEDDVKSEAE